jgi:hypothetical protein
MEGLLSFLFYFKSATNGGLHQKGKPEKISGFPKLPAL